MKATGLVFEDNGYHVDFTTLWDSSIYGNDGVLTNSAATIVDVGALGLKSGTYDGAVAGGGYVNLGNDDSLQEIYNHLTYEAWIYQDNDALAAVQGIISSLSGGGVFAGPCLRVDDVMRIMFLVGEGGGVTVSARDPVALLADTWYHVVGTYDGTTAIIYKNGNQEDTQAGTMAAITVDTVIGRNFGDDNSHYFSGYIVLSRIYSFALSAAQVWNRYTATRGQFQ